MISQTEMILVRNDQALLHAFNVAIVLLLIFLFALLVKVTLHHFLSR